MSYEPGKGFMEYSLSFSHYIYELLVNNFDDLERLLARDGINEDIPVKVWKVFA